jgi:DNA-binding beta-propeller fold protein YncE
MYFSALLAAACSDPSGGTDSSGDSTASDTSGQSDGTGTDSVTAETEASTMTLGDGDGDGDSDADATAGDGDSATGDGDGDGDGDPLPDCDNLVPLPLEFAIIEGARRAEDFVFDAEGYVLTVEGQNIFRTAYGESYELLYPGVAGGGASGTGMLPNGDVVFNEANLGQVTRVTPDGQATALVGGLPYPNGIQVDDQGWVWVALNDGDAVIRFDPDNPQTEVVFESSAPNGLAFSADYRRLYVGSYNNGGVKEWDLDTEELTVIDDELGGVDGVLTDVCDNVYVTQYGNGLVWRIAPDLSKEMVVDLETNWIPNLNFGSGLGGWEHDRIYINDRENDRVFEVSPGIWGIDQPQL